MNQLNDLLVKFYKTMQPYTNGATIFGCILIMTLLCLFRKTRKAGIILYIIFMLVTAAVFFGALETLK